MNCTHSLGTPGRPCPWACGAVVPESADAERRPAPAPAGVEAGGVDDAPDASPRREIVQGVAADREAAGGPPPRVHGSLDGHPSLFDAMPAPAARFTDPPTSHLAAASVTTAAQRDSHRLVLDLLAARGPLTDFALAAEATRVLGRTVKQTSLGVRRKELVTAGLVCEHDRAGVSDTGSPCIRWALVAQEVAA